MQLDQVMVLMLGGSPEIAKFDQVLVLVLVGSLEIAQLDRGLVLVLLFVVVVGSPEIA